MTYAEPLPDKMADLIATLHLVTASKKIAEMSGITTVEALEQVKAETQALTQALSREQIKSLFQLIDDQQF